MNDERPTSHDALENITNVQITWSESSFEVTGRTFALNLERTLRERSPSVAVNPLAPAPQSSRIVCEVLLDVAQFLPTEHGISFSAFPEGWRGSWSRSSLSTACRGAGSRNEPLHNDKRGKSLLGKSNRCQIKPIPV